MIEVQAIKDTDTIKLISHLLNIRFSQQMSDIWNIGINLALRISDLLSIKFTDIEDGRIIIKEAKTGKVASIALNTNHKILSITLAKGILTILTFFNLIETNSLSIESLTPYQDELLAQHSPL
jgi:integrase